MITKFKRPLARILILSFSLLLIACQPSPRLYLKYQGQLTESELDQLLDKNPLPATENIRVTTLGKGSEISHHLVQIRNRESPHIHRNHDLTVVVMRGKGHLWLDERRLELRRGDLLFIPRGTVHYFVNTSPSPSVALAVFSPAFDGKDSVPVTSPSAR